MAIVGSDVLAVEPILWAPSWTSVTQGVGAFNEGWYVIRNDGLIDYAFRLQFGATPSFAATALITLPFAAWVGSGTSIQMCVGGWTFRDSTSPHHYSGSMGIWSSTGSTASFNGAWDATAPRARITNLIPFTVAETDVLSGFGCYLPA